METRIIVTLRSDAFSPNVGAIVEEEDTYLVLSADPTATPPAESPDRLLQRAQASIARAPGSVHVRGGSPPVLLAVVHDLDREPSWQESWIASALDAILEQVESSGFRAVALPLLGTVHGTLDPRRSAELLADALDRPTAHHLAELWLVVRHRLDPAVLEPLERFPMEWHP